MNLPSVYRIRQSFDPTKVEDVPGTVRAQLKKLDLDRLVKPGQRVGLAVGSRGIANLAQIVSSAVELLRSLGAEPFIFPAMGAHGGATAEGQAEVLAAYGVTEASVRAPILSSMETVEVGKTEDGVPVFVDANACRADWVVVVNRVKPHTKFKAPIESGLMKMMAIGMGKRKGAEYFHKAAIDYTLPKIIVDAGREALKRLPILCGLAIVENGYEQTAAIVGLGPQEIESREVELLKLAKRLMPRLPFDNIDLLIVDEMGKDISGIGIDPNVTGRNRDLLGTFDHPTQAKRVFVRDLSSGSHGNAIGIGLADVTTTRLVRKIDYRATYVNAITGISLEKAAVPMHFETDREAISVALGSLGLTPSEKSRIVRIKNTLLVDELEVSRAYEPELSGRPDLEVLDGPRPMSFDGDGNLLPLIVQGARADP